jgi:aerobic carbon-monoxide dehydrogenase large subunit
VSASGSRVQSSLTVNGTEVSVDVDPWELLVDALRDRLGLTGTKVGCETGECGACTVLLDGKAVKSCLVLAASADGSKVTTVEGLAGEGELSPIQEAFWQEYATQDGFTTPGVMMSVADLLSRNPDPTSEEIRAWLDGNLCRVTGYHNLVRAVHSAAKRLAGDEPASPQENGRLIGASVPPTEAPAMLRGREKFIADVSLPGMVYASILRSPHGHARIVSIDTAAASSAPGVIRVFTGPDVAAIMPLPVIWVPQDVESHFPPHPSGIVPGSGMTVLATDRVRFAGDAVAVVVAGTQQQADVALQLIAVEYEVLPAVTEVQDALADGAPQLHDAVPGNLVFNATLGDKDAADAAIAHADVVVKQTIRNQRSSPTPSRRAVTSPTTTRRRATSPCTPTSSRSTRCGC